MRLAILVLASLFAWTAVGAPIAAFSDNPPFPIYGVPYTVMVSIYKNDGTVITSATGLDSEVSINGETPADCTNEATELGTSGQHYLRLTGTEMTAAIVNGITKCSSASAVIPAWTLYPRVCVQIHTGTCAAKVSTAVITLQSTALKVDRYYEGCYIYLATKTGADQGRMITGYVGSTQVATVTPAWATQPDTDTTYIVYGLEGRQVAQADLVATLGTASPAKAGYVGVDWAYVANPTSTIDLKNTTIGFVTASTVTGTVTLANGAHGGANTEITFKTPPFVILADATHGGVNSVLNLKAIAISNAAGPGINIVGGGAGMHGIEITSNEGSGIYVKSNDGDGITVVGTGAGHFDISADIQGGITGDLTGKVTGTVAGVTPYSGTPPTTKELWEYDISGIVGVGFAGTYLLAAGGAADPWLTKIPGAYGAGTAGKILGDSLTKLETTWALDGAAYRFTAAALALGPGGGTGLSAQATRDAMALALTGGTPTPATGLDGRIIAIPTATLLKADYTAPPTAAANAAALLADATVTKGGVLTVAQVLNRIYAGQAGKVVRTGTSYAYYDTDGTTLLFTLTIVDPNRTPK